MPQTFHRSTNTLSKVSIFGALFLVVGSLFAIAEINRSGYVTQAGVPPRSAGPRRPESFSIESCPNSRMTVRGVTAPASR